MRYERERRSGARRRVKHESARAPLLVLGVVLCAGLGAAWFALRGPGHGESAAPAARTEIVPPRADPAVARRIERDPTPTSPPDVDPLRFEGRGRIRGVLEHRGVEPTARWTLVVEPDPRLVGSGRADSRRLEFQDGETRFEVDDLPFGGYRVHAETEGANGVRVPVLLARGATDATVTLRLAPLGFVDGFVFDGAGRPAEGLAVHVEHRGTRRRVTGYVDVTGLFVVHGVADGECEIRLGEFDGPLVAPGTFTFRAPSLRWHESRLPPTGALLVRVRDRSGRGLGDLEVSGRAPPANELRARTGADGSARAPFVLPGRYTIEVHGQEGRLARAVAEITASGESAIELVVD